LCVTSFQTLTVRLVTHQNLKPDDTNLGVSLPQCRTCQPPLADDGHGAIDSLPIRYQRGQALQHRRVGICRQLSS
jgi:hypothetical protein